MKHGKKIIISIIVVIGALFALLFKTNREIDNLEFKDLDEEKA